MCGIHFYKPINIGEVLKINAHAILTGKSSKYITNDIYYRKLDEPTFRKNHILRLFFSDRSVGNKLKVREWIRNPKILKLS